MSVSQSVVSRHHQSSSAKCGSLAESRPRRAGKSMDLSRLSCLLSVPSWQHGKQTKISQTLVTSHPVPRTIRCVEAFRTHHDEKTYQVSTVFHLFLLRNPPVLSFRKMGMFIFSLFLFDQDKKYPPKKKTSLKASFPRPRHLRNAYTDSVHTEDEFQSREKKNNKFAHSLTHGCFFSRFSKVKKKYQVPGIYRKNNKPIYINTSLWLKSTASINLA